MGHTSCTLAHQQPRDSWPHAPPLSADGTAVLRGVHSAAHPRWTAPAAHEIASAATPGSRRPERRRRVGRWRSRGRRACGAASPRGWRGGRGGSGQAALVNTCTARRGAALAKPDTQNKSWGFLFFLMGLVVALMLGYTLKRFRVRARPPPRPGPHVRPAAQATSAAGRRPHSGCVNAQERLRSTRCLPCDRVPLTPTVYAALPPAPLSAACKDVHGVNARLKRNWSTCQHAQQVQLQWRSFDWNLPDRDGAGVEGRVTRGR